MYIHSKNKLLWIFFSFSHHFVCQWEHVSMYYFSGFKIIIIKSSLEIPVVLWEVSVLELLLTTDYNAYDQCYIYVFTLISLLSYVHRFENLIIHLKKNIINHIVHILLPTFRFLYHLSCFRLNQWMNTSNQFDRNFQALWGYKSYNKSTIQILLFFVMYLVLKPNHTQNKTQNESYCERSIYKSYFPQTECFPAHRFSKFLLLGLNFSSLVLFLVFWQK